MLKLLFLGMDGVLNSTLKILNGEFNVKKLLIFLTLAILLTGCNKTKVLEKDRYIIIKCKDKLELLSNINSTIDEYKIKGFTPTIMYFVADEELFSIKIGFSNEDSNELIQMGL